MKQQKKRRAEIMQAVALEIELRRNEGDADEADEPVDTEELAEVLGCLLRR
ncbi:hypothetical protein ACFL5Q_07390 [Planctomycetota bacterium]